METPPTPNIKVFTPNIETNESQYLFTYIHSFQEDKVGQSIGMRESEMLLGTCWEPIENPKSNTHEKKGSEMFDKKAPRETLNWDHMNIGC